VPVTAAARSSWVAARAAVDCGCAAASCVLAWRPTAAYGQFYLLGPIGCGRTGSLRPAASCPSKAFDGRGLRPARCWPELVMLDPPLPSWCVPVLGRPTALLGSPQRPCSNKLLGENSACLLASCNTLGVKHLVNNLIMPSSSIINLHCDHHAICTK